MSEADKRKIKQLTRAEINKLDMLKLREKYNELYKAYIFLLNNSSKYKSLEELGFEKEISYGEIQYYKKCRQWREEGKLQIEINTSSKNVDIVFLGSVSGNLPAFLDLEELQAINKKVEELRMELSKTEKKELVKYLYQIKKITYDKSSNKYIFEDYFGEKIIIRSDIYSIISNILDKI